MDNYINGKNSVFLRVNPNISQKIVPVMLVTSEQSAIFAAKNKFVINYGWFLNPSIIYAETVINSYFEAYKTGLKWKPIRYWN
ncbi:hypothetical protein HYE36_04660 [Mycoplasmopsis bovis]|nr:hypothetical protein [Mycoplasmopsis bovis]WHL49195.1 hypothetical protein HYE36_04660 [Mycoplasmopsis bovis]